VIWRLRNGELEGIHPKLAVLMIGTNNGSDPAEAVALGVKTIIEDIQQRSPGTRIILLGIFPRGESPGSGRRKNESVNAKIEAAIAAGGIVSGGKALEKLSFDKDADTVEAAKASLAIVAAWKASIDAELSRLQTIGDVFTAADLATAMAKLYPGDAGKTYKDHAADMRKDPDYAAGKDYQKLAEAPYEARKDPRFAKMVEVFLTKHPDGYYAEQAKALIIK